MDEEIAKLVADYCPPVEEALVHAIASDFDLTTQDGVKAARDLFDGLHADAEIEAAAGFDPSGSGGVDGSSPVAGGTDTDPTRLANDVSSLSLSVDESPDKEIGIEDDWNRSINALPLEKKAEVLHEMCQDKISLHSVTYTLRKCDGDFQSAMNELLNHVWISESVDEADGGKAPTKGIDAFFEGHAGQQRRKGRKRNRRTQNDTSSTSAPTSQSPPATPNMWKAAPEDIEFIADKSGIPVNEVRAMYHEQGASVPKTIMALVKASMDITKLIVTNDEDVLAHAQELGRDFPNMKVEILTALIRLTYPSTKRAHALAKAMTAAPKINTNGGIQIVPKYTPVSASVLEGTESWQTVPNGKKARSAASSISPIRTDEGAVEEARRLATAAYNQAGMYRRRAGLDRLAAGYYYQESREQRARGMTALSGNADAVAAQQSSATYVDLHGIDVLNGVRIAREYVGTWYAGLGENRVNGRIGAANRNAGFGVVVGKGSHSEGGKSKLGPAVGKMLRDEGWKVENNGAVLLVKGKVRG